MTQESKPLSQGPNDNVPEKLASRLAGGDTAALAELFEMFRARLRRVIEARMDHRLKKRVDPSDILQEAYLNLEQRLPAFVDRQEKMSLFVWMRLVAMESVVNSHRHHLGTGKRDARRDRAFSVPDDSDSSICLVENLLGRFNSAGQVLLKKELQAALMEALKTLDAIDQEIIIMRCFEDLSNKEAAESLNLSPSGASNRFVRAMTRLRKQLDSFPGLFE